MFAPAYQFPATVSNHALCALTEGPSMRTPNPPQSPSVPCPYPDETQCKRSALELSPQAARAGVESSRSLLTCQPDHINPFIEQRGRMLDHAEDVQVPTNPPSRGGQAQLYSHFPLQVQPLLSRESIHAMAHASTTLLSPDGALHEQNIVSSEVLCAARSAFDGCDVGKFGTLDFKQFLAALELLKINLPYHDAQACFAKSWTEKHGRLSPSDFASAYLRILCFSQNSCHLRRYV